MQTKNASFVALCAIFAFLLFCNIMLPPQSDDLNHAFSAQEGFQSAINSYMNWNARIGELLNVGFFAGLNPYFFDLLNAAVGVAFFALFFTLIFARLPRDFKDASTLALIALTILYLAPFGSVFAWGAGSVNYLWGLTLILAFLLPYRVAFLVAFLPLNKMGGGIAII